MKTLGIIGGLGPMATAYFLQLITQMSDAQTDQEHMEIVIYSKPAIPDRTRYILGQSTDSPLDDMIAVGEKLRQMGADIIAIPCITAHYFHRQLEEQLGVPIIHAIRESALWLEKEKVQTVGVLATDGTLQSGLVQDILTGHGIQPLLLKDESQRELMGMIYDGIKAGKPYDMNCFMRLSDELLAQGAQKLLLACTELSLIKRDHPLSDRYLDLLEVLAGKAVERCGKIREEYRLPTV